jgi:hypothetical protein
MRIPAVALISILMVADAAAESVTGVWEGLYVCPQGATRLRLSLNEGPSHTVEAVFAFSSPDAASRIPSGCFSLRGTHDPATGRMTLKQSDWIQQPEGWIMVDMEGWVDVTTGSYDGVIKTAGCSVFGVKRSLQTTPDLKAACVTPTS